MPLFGQVRAASSCQDEIILPWARQEVPDEDFPATGPIYKEAVRGTLPGLAGREPLGRLERPVVRPGGVGGPNVVALGDDKFAATALPALGVNPQQPDTRPPLRADVPCETQPSRSTCAPSRATRRTQFQAPIATRTPPRSATRRREKTAIDWTARAAQAAGPRPTTLKISDQELTLEQLRDIKPTTPEALDGMIGKKR